MGESKIHLVVSPVPIGSGTAIRGRQNVVHVVVVVRIVIIVMRRHGKVAHRFLFDRSDIGWRYSHEVVAVGLACPLPTTRGCIIPFILDNPILRICFVFVINGDTVKDRGVYVVHRHFFSKDRERVVVGGKVFGEPFGGRIIAQQVRTGAEVDGGSIGFGRQVVRADAPGQKGECDRHGSRYAYDAERHR